MNHTESDLHEIQYALEGMRRLTENLAAATQEQVILNELIREDVRFHIAIMTAAKNDLMKKEILRLHLINRVLSTPSGVEPAAATKAIRDARRTAVMAKHDEIYAAISRSDAVAAKSSMEFHLQEMIDHTLRVMTRSESGVIARELTPEELVYRS
jgi:DNA-binding FadR family transcriptional regulator